MKVWHDLNCFNHFFPTAIINSDVNKSDLRKQTRQEQQHRKLRNVAETRKDGGQLRQAHLIEGIHHRQRA